MIILNRFKASGALGKSWTLAALIAAGSFATAVWTALVTAAKHRLKRRWGRWDELQRLKAFSLTKTLPSSSSRPSICFQESGCVILYHVGVGTYLKDTFDLSDVTFCGASGGSIVAALLATGSDMEYIHQA